MKKALALILAFVLVIGATIAGTLAYLTDTSKKVENTFTIGKVIIDLHETEKDSDDISYGNEYALIPGTTYEKDPVVSVDPDSEDCYLFVKFDETNKQDWLSYTSNLTAANGWMLVNGETNVWYREVKKTDTTRSWELLKDNTITVTKDLTQENMPTSADAAPKLVYTAYACQKANLSVAEAWAQVKNLAPEA